MASPIAQKDIDAVANLKVFIYVNSIFIGISEAGEHPLEINHSASPQGSATSGDNGAYLSVDQGSHAMFTCTVHGFDKSNINTIDPVLFNAETAVSNTNPFTGRLSLESKPDILNNYPIVLKPEFVEKSTGTKWTTELANPLTMLLNRAAFVESVTIPNNSNEIVKMQYTFRAHTDLLNDNRFGLIGANIDTDGTVTAIV
jgi:hypothetical protein